MRFSQEDVFLNLLYDKTKDFADYHKKTLPLCAAENIISPFVNLPLTFGFQERYIMNNAYSYDISENFIGSEKLLPFYIMISDACKRIFRAKYSDSRAFTGMNCLCLVLMTITQEKDKILILSSQHGGHASVKPLCQRLGLITLEAPYDLEENDLDYEKLNNLVENEKINHILLAPSDLIKPLNVEKICTKNTTLLYDVSQILGLIAAGLIENPLDKMENLVLFGGTHKTFPGPACGLILTNNEDLHMRMETSINPKYIRHTQMHQKVSLLFALLEFEKYGEDYQKQIVYTSNYLGKRLKDAGFEVKNIHGSFSATHQIFIECPPYMADIIYENSYRYGVTLNKKRKALITGIRLGTQEIARYKWENNTLDRIAEILAYIAKEKADDEYIYSELSKLPPKDIHFTVPNEVTADFKEFMML